MKPIAIQRWTRLEPPKRALLFEAVGAICVASLAVKLLPFKWAIRLSSNWSSQPSRIRSAEALSSLQWAIDVAARRAPWKPVCIQRGLAAQWMLRRRGIDARLHYGLAADQTDLTAHVWVEAFGETLVGGEDAGAYVRIATFP